MVVVLYYVIREHCICLCSYAIKFYFNKFLIIRLPHHTSKSISAFARAFKNKESPKEADSEGDREVRLIFSLLWEILDTFDKFEIPYLPKIFTLLILCHIFLFTKSILLPMNVCKLLDEWQTV